MRTASQDPTQPLVYVADNTIGGHQLEPLKKQRIHHLLGLSEGESIEIIYSNNGKFDTDKNVLVGLTNRRIFKIEDEIVSRILISNLVSIRHVENDIFSSDKLHCELIGGESITFSIFHRKACKFFYDRLYKTIHMHQSQPVSIKVEVTPFSLREAPLSPLTPATPITPEPKISSYSHPSLPIPIPALRRQIAQPLSPSVLTGKSSSPIVLKGQYLRPTSHYPQYSPPLASFCSPNSPVSDSFPIGSPTPTFKLPTIANTNLSPPTLFFNRQYQSLEPIEEMLSQSRD